MVVVTNANRNGNLCGSIVISKYNLSHVFEKFNSINSDMIKAIINVIVTIFLCLLRPTINNCRLCINTI